MNDPVKSGFALTLLAILAAPGVAAAQASPQPPRTDSPAAQANSPAAPPNSAAPQPNAQAAAPSPASPVSPEKSSARSISEPEVIELALRHNPDLEVARLSEKQAAYGVQSEEAAYPFVLQANAGYTRSATPSVSANNAVVVATRDSFGVGSSLLKDFPTGTQVSLSLQGERTTTRRPSGLSIAGERTGLTYSLSSRLSVTQPLLRGAWNRVGELGLRTARLERESRTGARERVASEVVRDSMLGYWELWYASRALDIEIAAHNFAAAQRAEAEARRAQGAISPVDVLAFDTRLASLKEEVTVSELQELQRSLELAQLLGIEAPKERFRATGSPVDPATPSQGEVEMKLLQQSPELKELEARVAVADARADVAGDAFRPRLDLEGHVEVRGLGNRAVAPAFGQVGSLNAVGAYAGVFFETPLTGKRESAEVAAARLDSQIAKSQLEAAKGRIRIAASRLIAQLEAAKARRTAAQQTAQIAEKQLDAERSRFTLGTSTPLQVQEAEDAVRRARLRVARATVDLVQAGIEIEHAIGDISGRLTASRKSSP